jgi:hypothetical protein
MTIKVYYSCLENERFRFKSPEPVIKNFIKSKNFFETGIEKCPAFKDSIKNTFSLQSIYDYSFDVYENRVESKMYDESFFDRHVEIRSLKEKTFSFNQWITFFTEENSLELTTNIFPFLEENNITKNCIMPPGKYDIGKWFRNIEFVFKLKEESNTFTINEDEVYQYIKFETNEKIELIPYFHDEEIEFLLKHIMKTKNYTDKKRNLQSYYEFYKIKKILTKKIKNNAF